MLKYKTCATNKYKNSICEVDGIKFHSKKEANRYKELKLMRITGIIKELKRQVPFVLQESFKKNNVTYRGIKYIADFVYEQDGKTIIEDAKGYRTPEYEIKKKLFEYKYKDLTIREV